MKVELLDHMGSDLDVVNAARVSFDKESEWDYKEDLDVELIKATKILSDKDTKLILYLVEHQHWSPFSHVVTKFRVKAPIFVARQLAKHQVGGSWNEVSRRYVDSEPEFYVPEVWRKRAEDKKQGSSAESINPIEAAYASRDYAQVVEGALNIYKLMLRRGVCPEQARMVLPQSMMTEWQWTGSLAFWARVYRLRMHETAQEECKPIVEAIGIEMEKLFPVSWRALVNVAS